MKQTKFHIFCFSLLMAVVVGCDTPLTSDELDLSNYQPVDKFVPAYEALTNRTDLTSNQDYDIEKTVRIINALEIAQVKSKDFNEFLEYMAKQDYTGVAPDVLEAKQKLLPLLQYMYKLQGKDKQLNDMWMLARSAAKGTTAIDDPMKLVGVIAGNPFAILDIRHSEDASKATEAAFTKYEEDKKLKSKMKSDIEKLHGSYLKYLTDYAPIYHKYMKEYDAICVQKDKAYLDLYSGRTDDALSHTRQILKKYPNNSETQLLQSMALIVKGSTQPVQNRQELPVSNQPELTLPDTLNPQPQNMNVCFAEANNMLNNYMEQNPGKTAPALLMKGLLEQKLGNEQAALSYFDQASMEYPRQAVQLTDMLDSYRTRTYLNKTTEGQYLQRLYASTMEGYGMFSPNLLKAKYYADQGDKERSSDEIFNHFFRSSNQGIYDGLLSDMQFCEEHLYGPFKQLLIESAYLDVEIEPESEWLFWNSDDLLNVKINNRSDINLENVRLFLCIHYTDMYKDEYDIVKVPRTVNIIPKHSTADFDTLRISYGDKKYDDITRIRAIAVTDNRICWVDDVKYKRSHVLDQLRSGRTDATAQQRQDREEFLKNYSLSPDKLRQTLKEGVKVLQPEENPAEERSWWDQFCGWFSRPDNDLKIELPRVLTMLDPVFSLHAIDGEDALSPEENYLSGMVIHLQFDYEPQNEELLPLFIYSDMASFRVDILYKGGESEVQQVVAL
ncbi:MAG: hypothetical protein IJ527_06500 [Prevotella sp.]|nr:hypothetical protein [Prevotella sp.]